jgi:hypothetical protein
MSQRTVKLVGSINAMAKNLKDNNIMITIVIGMVVILSNGTKFQQL